MDSKNYLIGYGAPNDWEEWMVVEDGLTFTEAERKIEELTVNEKLAIWMFNPAILTLTKICGQKVFEEQIH